MYTALTRPRLLAASCRSHVAVFCLCLDDYDYAHFIQKWGVEYFMGVVDFLHHLRLFTQSKRVSQSREAV
jgi:hypothetical protein